MNISRLFGFLLASLLSTQVLAADEGFSGLPNSITGGGVPKVDALGDVDSKVKSGVRYSRGAVAQDFDIVKPATEKPAVVHTNNESGYENSSELVYEDDNDEYEGDEYEGNEALDAGQAPEVEFEIPDGYSVVTKNSQGVAHINGDSAGTYIIKVPALLYSKIELPFAAALETPFPDQVVIKQKEDVILVAPRGVVPVNLILYHPERPTVSVSLVLLPVSTEIPATIKVKFDEKRIPAAKQDQDKLGEFLGEHKVSTINATNANQVLKYDRAASHVDLMRKINADIARGYVPDGYSLRVVTEGPTGALCGDKRLLGKYVQNIVGVDFEIDVFRVKNAASDYVEFREKSCYRTGVSAVFFSPSGTLAPGMEAELIIIHSRKTDVDDTRVRRPTRVSAEQ